MKFAEMPIEQASGPIAACVSSRIRQMPAFTGRCNLVSDDVR